MSGSTSTTFEIQKRPAKFSTVDQLRPDTSGHNLKVKVVSTTPVKNRPGGRGGQGAVKIAECTIGDATGMVVFSARNEQIDLARPGKYLILRNAKVDMFRGCMRIVVTQWGKIEASPDLDFEPRVKNNLSLVEYELVPIPSQSRPAPPAQQESQPAPEHAAATAEAVPDPEEPASAGAPEPMTIEAEAHGAGGFEAKLPPDDPVAAGGEGGGAEEVAAEGEELPKLADAPPQSPLAAAK